jgi:SNF2 family DNA or RNA helicase
MKPYFLRRRKRDVLPDLPPIMEQIVPVELEGEQHEAYESLWDSRFGLNRDGQAVTEVSMLAFITELKQLCNLHEPSGSRSRMTSLKRFSTQRASLTTRSSSFLNMSRPFDGSPSRTPVTLRLSSTAD